MNKTVNIIMIVLLSIITIAVTGFFIYLMTGGSFNWTFNFNSYSDNLIESKDVSYVDEISVDGKNTKVTVENSTDEKIHVELYSDNEVEHSISYEANKLDIKFYDNEIFRLFKKNSRVLIKLPKDYENKLNINLSVGDVKISSFEKLNPNIVVGTGDIRIDNINNLNAQLTTGDVKINNVNNLSCKIGTGDVKVENVNDATINGTTGDIKINEINNSADISLTTGDVKINNATIKQDSSINLTTGDVKIKSYSGAYVETTNSVGDVKVNNNDRRSENTLKITVRVGDIKIN